MSNDAWLDRTDRRYAKAARKIANKAQRAEEFEHRQRISAAQGAVGLLGRFYDSLHAKATKPVDSIDPRLMSDDDLVASIRAALEADRYDWRGSRARPEQIQPAHYRTWLVLAGRGFGKTEIGTQAIREWCSIPDQRIAVVGADHRAIRDTLLDGPSGLLKVFPPEDVRSYKSGLGDVTVTLMNGSVIYGFPAENPDSVRGRAFDGVLCDEYGAWNRNTAEDMIAQLWFCMRDTPDPRMIMTTTPRRVPHIVNLIKRSEASEPGLVVTRGRTRDNKALSEVALQQLERMYAGTRMGRQELEGELVLDVENALFTGDMVEGAHWDLKDKDGFPLPLPPMIGVVVGLDPSGSKDGDATGVVTIGWDKDKTLYVLENTTRNGTPAERYTAVCMSAFRHGAGEVWFETSYGGDQSAYGVEQQWKNLIEAGDIPVGARCPRMMPSRVKGDKAGRAGPVVTLYEQQLTVTDRKRIWHASATVENGLTTLEDEMLSWSTDSNKSPNALDALVHAARAVMRLTGQEITFSAPVRATQTGAPARRVSGGYRVY